MRRRGVSPTDWADNSWQQVTSRDPSLTALNVGQSNTVWDLDREDELLQLEVREVTGDRTERGDTDWNLIE